VWTLHPKIYVAGIDGTVSADATSAEPPTRLQHLPHRSSQRDYSRYQRPIAHADALGPDPSLVEEVYQRTPGNIQRTIRNRCRKANLPRCFPTQSMPDSCFGLLRVAYGWKGQATLLHHASKGIGVDVCRGTIASCTILIADANKFTSTIHDRMPVILEPENIGPWLKGEAGKELLKPAPEDALRMWPVSKSVSKPGNTEDATLIEPVALQSTAPDTQGNLLLH
jgi:hypothetical protein